MSVVKIMRNFNRQLFPLYTSQGEGQPGRDAGQREGRHRGPRVLLRPPGGRFGGLDRVGTVPAEALWR